MSTSVESSSPFSAPAVLSDKSRQVVWKLVAVELRQERQNFRDYSAWDDSECKRLCVQRAARYVAELELALKELS